MDSIHRELGQVLWDACGMSRNRADLDLAIERIAALRDLFWRDARVTGSGNHLNRALERAGRVADFLEFGETMCRDALTRDESCGVHFREEHQTPDGEAQRDDERFCHVAAWEWTGPDAAPQRHTEPLAFTEVTLAARSYK